MKRHFICLSKQISQNNYSKPLCRFVSSNETTERRNHLFTLEKKRQHENVGRIEKIEVQYKGPKECTLIMNKDLSTPHDCARHLSEWHVNTSALALLDGTVYWDMHRPLTENCVLELQNFSVDDPNQLNRAFWRTCSMLLGAAATVAFKDNIPVKLHSFPGPDIRSGSFVYDVDLPSLEEWKPTDQELRTLGAECVKLSRQNLALERLDVSEALALEMFVADEHKSKQIPSIAARDGKVTVYRMGSHVDMSKGPMIANTSQIGRYSVTAVHTLQGGADSGVKQLYRFQGVALPAGVHLNHFAFSILQDRARKLNHARSPINGQFERKERQRNAATA